MGTAPALPKKAGELPKALCLSRSIHRQSQALIILHNQVILKMRVSPPAPQRLSLFLQWLGAHHPTTCLCSPTSPPKTTSHARSLGNSQGQPQDLEAICGLVSAGPVGDRQRLPKISGSRGWDSHCGTCPHCAFLPSSIVSSSSKEIFRFCVSPAVLFSRRFLTLAKVCERHPGLSAGGQGGVTTLGTPWVSSALRG